MLPATFTVHESELTHLIRQFLPQSCQEWYSTADPTDDKTFSSVMCEIFQVMAAVETFLLVLYTLFCMFSSTSRLYFEDVSPWIRDEQDTWNEAFHHEVRSSPYEYLLNRFAGALRLVQWKAKEHGDKCDECPICLGEFEEDQDALQSIQCCDRLFHPRCLTHWLRIRTSCPCCRSSFRKMDYLQSQRVKSS